MDVRTYGLLLRVYTPKPEEVEDRVHRAMLHVRHFFEVSKDFPALRNLVLLVPRDYDCGRTFNDLRGRLIDEGFHDKVTTYTSVGHHSCDVLNHGINIAGDVSHALIVSGKAMKHLTPISLRAMDQAFAHGAKVAGLAIDDLRMMVLEGRIQNTFAGWNIKSLLQASHGFDSKTGVEEIAPLVRLTQMFGKCIAPIDVGASALDVHTSESAKARHELVMTTKLERQMEELRRVHSDFAAIKFGIMPNYPRSI